MTELSEQTRELLAEWVEIKDRLGADSFDGIEPSYRDRLDLVANRTRLLLAEGQAPSYENNGFRPEPARERSPSALQADVSNTGEGDT